MIRRQFLHDTTGISILYDVVLFMVLVSLAGVMLLPALQNNIATRTSLEKHREHVADEALHALLVSKPDFLTYRFSGDLIDNLAHRLGIHNTTEGLYATITQWFLGHEQRHKTYAALIAEDLGSQFCLPVTCFGINRLNIFTSEYDQMVQSEIERFFNSYLGEKYRYNLTAYWHPIKTVSFGGELSCGVKPPQQDCYVSRARIMMPYTPKITVGNHTIVLTKQWVKNQLLNNDESESNGSSIPEINNILYIVGEYLQEHPPFDTRDNATRATQENLSTILKGFLVDGLQNELGAIVFPGIVNMTLECGFDQLKRALQHYSEEALNETFGESIQMMNSFFGSLNQSVGNPLVDELLNKVNTTLQGYGNFSDGPLDQIFGKFEQFLMSHISSFIDDSVNESTHQFVSFVFDVMEIVQEFTDFLIDWFFDQISLNSAEVILTLWVVRE